jgi:hypothetical protein
VTWAPVFLTLASYAAFLLLRHNAPLLHRLALSSMAVLDGMLSDVPEDDKLTALEQATSSLVLGLLKFLGLVVAGGTCIATPCMFVDSLGLGLLATWQGIAAVSAGGTLAFVMPKVLPRETRSGAAASDHSPLSQLLHKMVLDHPHIHTALMRREIRNWKAQGGTPNRTYLLVTGLARAGTTSMLERLVASGDFHSLNYANMPLVLAPGTWRRVHNPSSSPKKERSHGDGILVGNDSAEALEEVFFQAMAGEPYVRQDAVVAHHVDAEGHATYLDYQGIALATAANSGAMYVAKNNNALLRYPSLREQNRDFHAVVMFREPMTHAASLLAMHRKYCAMQQDDPFVKTYMDWLAHHEFGLGQKPFKFTEHTALPQGDRDTLDHWLDLWINHYEAALAMDRHRLHFIGYERYCAQPTEVLKGLTRKVGVEVDWDVFEPYTKQRKVEGDVNPAKLERATRLYNEMQARQRG